MFAGWAVIQVGAIIVFKFDDYAYRRECVEERSSRLSLLPMLCAEKERM
jgi:hypothetical protein